MSHRYWANFLTFCKQPKIMKILNKNLQKLDEIKKFGLSDLENDLLTSMTSEEAEWFFSKIIFLKSVDQAEKNVL